MIVDYKEIIKSIRKMWPKIYLPWLPDSKYFITDINTVIESLMKSGVKDYENQGEVFDCDDFALQANAYIKRNERSDGVPWAFGEALGDKYKGREMIHTLNICYTTDGFYFIEPQGYYFWKADSNNDNVLMVKI